MLLYTEYPAAPGPRHCNLHLVEVALTLLPPLSPADSLSPGVQLVPGRLPESARGVFERTLNRCKTGLRVLLRTSLGVLLLLLAPRVHLFEDARQA